MGGDFYQRLGVEPEATAEEIRQAFRDKAFELHPDHNPGGGQPMQKRFLEAKEAYECLRDPGRRAAYDAIRASDFAGPGGFGRGGGGGAGSGGQEDFEDMFAKYWEPKGQRWRRPPQQQRPRSDDARAAEYMARAADWEEEKREARAVRERAQRVRMRAEAARQARTAATLRGFWQTHNGVTKQDVAAMAAVLLTGFAAAYSWWPAAAAAAPGAIATPPEQPPQPQQQPSS